MSYQEAGESGPVGGTSSEPLSRSPRCSSSESVPIAGIRTAVGADSGMTAGSWPDDDADVAAEGVVEAAEAVEAEGPGDRSS